MSNDLVASSAQASTSLGIFSANDFSGALVMAEKLSKSDLLPINYKNKPENCLIALDIANRVKTNPFAVMQNLNVIRGRPSWSSAFIISVINTSGRFGSILNFEIKDLGTKEIISDIEDDRGGHYQKKVTVRNKSCKAFTFDKNTKEKIEGPEVSMEMAVMEGWYFKSGSKWKTMPDVMLRYRAAAFFGRLYCPDLLMGMHTEDEVIDAEFSVATEPPAMIEELQPTEQKKQSRSRKTKEQDIEKASAIFDVNKESQTPLSVAYDAYDASDKEIQEIEAELVEENVPSCVQPRAISSQDDDGFSNFGD